MKITELVERECCYDDDLKEYNGTLDDNVKKFKFVFCSHCGQIWVKTKDMDTSGHMEWLLKKVIINEQCDWV